MPSGSTTLMNLARLSQGVRSCRFSSYDTTGGNADCWKFAPGQARDWALMQGPGCVRHIWTTSFGGDAYHLRALVLRMYWNGESTPSVQCPLGDFFGLGHGTRNYFSSMPLQSFDRGLNCWFPMPYADGARITLTNEGAKEATVYFYVDYQQWDRLPDEPLGLFHANWRRETVVKKEAPIGPCAFGWNDRLNTTGLDNYLVLDTQGKGHYVGCCLHLDTVQPGWWGEGDDMFFIDGEPWPPRLHGTGTEDYFCGAWNYNNLAQPFCTPYFGYHFKTNPDYTGKHSQYRFHVEDPIYFEKSLRFSIEHGHANDRMGDWTSTAYWYQINRSTPLPDLGTYESRIPYNWGGLHTHEGLDRKNLPG
ncbi:MAG: DUF2961 domain-containing protein [Phycisphaeraceae bacterium]|nr:DUF2961 domain-containing protein [Phycisphaeraceae bacterium]